jgi:Protein of unknown function (DUF4038)
VNPVIDSEPIDEDHPIGFEGAKYGYSTASDCRRFLSWDSFSGAFGHTYGHHSVWQMHTQARGSGMLQAPTDRGNYGFAKQSVAWILFIRGIEIGIVWANLLPPRALE